MSKYVFSSDWHLRSDQIKNRIDDFQQIQLDTLKYIANICIKNEARLLLAGDIFEYAKQENMQELLNQVYEIFRKINIYFIAGNHDLLFKNIENFNKCNIGILNKFDNWQDWHSPNLNIHFNFFHYGVEIKNTLENGKLRICVLHKYCEKDKLPNYIKNGITAKELLNNYDYDIFVVGDNHQAFEYEENNRFVFNTGCITRQSVNEKDYMPSVILFDTESKDYEIIYLPDCKQNLKVNVFKEEKMSNQIKRENTIDSCIKLIGENKSITLNLKDNFKTYYQKNKTEQEIINLIDNLLEEIKE